MFQDKALVLYFGLGPSDRKDTIMSHFQAENSQYLFIKDLLKISVLVVLSLALITFSLKVYAGRVSELHPKCVTEKSIFKTVSGRMLRAQ